MTVRLYMIFPCTVLPLVFFSVLAYSEIDKEVDRRLPLLSLSYISNHLTADIARVEAAATEFPPNYSAVLQEYRDLGNHGMLKAMEGTSSTGKAYSPPERAVAAFILWREALPHDFLTSDPVKKIQTDLAFLSRKVPTTSAKRSEILAQQTLEYLKYVPSRIEREVLPRWGLPPTVMHGGLVFCGEIIPLDRPDVLLRIEYQVEHLLGDMRDTTVTWLKRKSRFAPVVESILSREDVPTEFALLPALESGYSGSVVSPAMARGWWQFLKTTATKATSREPTLDWTLNIDSRRDERCDLALSTRSAARYLKWVRTKLSDGPGPAGWLITAAAYNAGLSEVAHRTSVYNTTSYWDIKLPIETEDYVPRWVALAIIDNHRDFYGMPRPTDTIATFDTIGGVQLAKDVPLGLLAVLTVSSVNHIRELNPGLSKTETSFKAAVDNHAVTHTIHVPVTCGEEVAKALNERGYLKGPPAELEIDRGRKIGSSAVRQ